MSNPEKDDKDIPKKNPESDPPKLDAILPDDPPPAGRILSRMDSYQKKIENEWEETKAAYHDRIDKIMEEYVQEKLPKLDAGAESAHAKDDTAASRFDFEMSAQRLDKLLSRAEKTLKFGAKKPMMLDYSDYSKPAIFDALTHLATRTGLGRFWTGVLSLIAGTLLVMYFFFPPVHTYRLPYNHTTGIQVSNGKITIVDWFRKSLIVHDIKKDLPILSIENMPNSFATGVAISDKHIWSIDGFNSKILEHALSPDHQVLTETTTPGKKAIGLYWDGTDLWSGDADEKMIYRHRGNDLEEIIDRFGLPPMTLAAFQVKDRHLWALDGKSRELYDLRLQLTPKIMAVYDLDPFIGQAAPTGFYIENDNIWLTTDEPASVIRIPLKRIVRPLFK